MAWISTCSGLKATLITPKEPSSMDAARTNTTVDDNSGHGERTTGACTLNGSTTATREWKTGKEEAAG
jgi:hypothetical protein